MTSKEPASCFESIVGEIFGELIQYHKSMDEYQEECIKKSQHYEIMRYKKRVFLRSVRRNIYGPEQRQMIIALACIRYERALKKNPRLALVDVAHILWCKYSFYLNENDSQLITLGTLATEVRRAHSLMNQPIEMMENSRSFINKAFVMIRKAKQIPGKMVFSPLFSMTIEEIEITMCCICF